MKGQLAMERHETGTPVKVIPAQVLANRFNDIHDMVARRAYELFESRGCVNGHDLDDWHQAEHELLFPCRHDLKDSAEGIILHAEMPNSFTAEQLKVGVEPRRVIVSGEREVSMLCGDGEGTHTEKRAQRVFRVHDLPVEVDPSRSTAVLRGDILDVQMPKVTAVNKTNEKADAASSGR